MKEFDNSRKRGNGLYSCEIGGGKIIRGFDMGLQMMSLGESATLIIPADYAYGEEGVDGMIPPNMDLIFEVDLYRINGKGFYTVEEKKAYEKRMCEWKDKRLCKYDNSKTFKEKKDQKYENRIGYSTFLDEKIKRDVNAVKIHLMETTTTTTASSINLEDLDAIDD